MNLRKLMKSNKSIKDMSMEQWQIKLKSLQFGFYEECELCYQTGVYLQLLTVTPVFILMFYKKCNQFDDLDGLAAETSGITQNK